MPDTALLPEVTNRYSNKQKKVQNLFNLFLKKTSLSWDKQTHF